MFPVISVRSEAVKPLKMHRVTVWLGLIRLFFRSLQGNMNDFTQATLPQQIWATVVIFSAFVNDQMCTFEVFRLLAIWNHCRDELAKRSQPSIIVLSRSRHRWGAGINQGQAASPLKGTPPSPHKAHYHCPWPEEPGWMTMTWRPHTRLGWIQKKQAQAPFGHI